MPQGYKFCPKCNTKTGPRAFNCKKCGHDYKAKSCKGKSLVYSDTNEAVVNPLSMYADRLDITWPKSDILYVFTPAKGPQDKHIPYPYKPKSLSDNDMQSWIKDIEKFTFDSGTGKESMYTRTAVNYLVNEFFPRYPAHWAGPGHHEDYTKAIELVNKYMKPIAIELLQGYK